jgi:hypothetical protein
MFWPLKTFYYVLPYNYYIRSALYLIFRETKWEACTDPFKSAICVDSTNGLAVLEAFSRVFPLVTTENTYWKDVICMLSLAIFWKIIAVVTILVKAGRVSQVRKSKETQSRRVSRNATADIELCRTKSIAVETQTLVQPVDSNVDDNRSEKSLDC